MLISPFTPIFFPDTPSDGVASRYTQVFANTDRILIQCLCDVDETPSLSLDTMTDNGVATTLPLTFNRWPIGRSGAVLWFAELRGLSNGAYSLMDSNNDRRSYWFRVTDDQLELEGTTLIQYAMADNRSRQDAIFLVDGIRYFFDFRVPGGFKDSGWTFAVDNEQFVTPDSDPVELFALESTQKRFTMGGQEGVPVWFAELLNRLLTCSYVYFDGIRYVRKEASAPEMTVQIEGVDSFVFSQLLQRVYNLDPVIENANKSALRKVDNDTFRSEAKDNDIVNRKI